MCTVTYIPFKEGFFLTSNRDEKITRRQAAAPAAYEHNGNVLVYPRDGAAGGTWIAVSQTGNAAVLLNGAFKKHVSTPPYRKSRGIVFTEIIASPEPYLHFLQTDLDNIEPFTLVLCANNNLYECRWDGTGKHHETINRQLPKIWSSATLYDDATMAKRERWFAEWLQKNANATQNDILQFHQFTGDGDSKNDLLMNRNDIMRTVSITGIEWTGDKATIRHTDLLKNDNSETCVIFAANKQLHGT